MSCLFSPFSLAQCTDFAQNQSAFTECHDALTRIDTQLAPTTNEIIVEEAALGHIHTWTEDFNAKHDDIQLNFDDPIFVESGVRVTFVGLRKELGASDRQLFLSIFEQGFGPIMQAAATIVDKSGKGYPSFEYRKTTWLMQQAASDLDPQRRLQQQEIPAIPSNLTNGIPEDLIPGDIPNIDVSSVELNNNTFASILVEAGCSGAACTNERLNDFLLESGNEYSDALTLALKSQGSAFFNDLDKVVFGDVILNDVISTPDLPPVYEPDTEVMIPFWIWIVLGVDCGILLLALAYGAIAAHMRAKRKPKHMDFFYGAKRVSLPPPKQAAASPFLAQPSQESPREDNSQRVDDALVFEPSDRDHTDNFDDEPVVSGSYSNSHNLGYSREEPGSFNNVHTEEDEPFGAPASPTSYSNNFSQDHKVDVPQARLEEDDDDVPIDPRFAKYNEDAYDRKHT